MNGYSNKIMEQWNGKIAVVTGASAGIGAAICQDLLKYELIVIGLARRPKIVMQLQYKSKKCRGKLHAYECDVSNRLSVLHAFTQIIKDFGTIHILINNAGISRGAFILSPSKYDKFLYDCINTNLMGSLHCSTLAYDIMTKNNENCYIINMNSILGHTMPPADTKPMFNVYPGTKHGLRSLTDTFQNEINKTKHTKIRISSISPGLVKTDIVQAAAAVQIQSVNEDKSGDNNSFGLFESNPCLTCQQVSDSIIFILSTPPHLQIQDIILKPLGEKS